MYTSKQVLQETLSAKVAQASQSQALALKGEQPRKRTVAETLADLDAIYGKKG